MFIFGGICLSRNLRRELQDRGKTEFMTTGRNPDAEAAAQYLTWALEEIEKFGHPKAAFHARTALEELRSVRSAERTDGHAFMYAEEAKRFRGKADEAEQLVERAETESRRDKRGPTRITTGPSRRKCR
jgi:hypothetical protein